mmetsp:Transcript_67508/g.119456  ORF Transcript_67508/g.119456 Transcript_67508/m.119456 type:complete len:83 (-) Transcript_67508:224-472(-)
MSAAVDASIEAARSGEVGIELFLLGCVIALAVVLWVEYETTRPRHGAPAKELAVAGATTATSMRSKLMRFLGIPPRATLNLV